MLRSNTNSTIWRRSVSWLITRRRFANAPPGFRNRPFPSRAGSWQSRPSGFLIATMRPERFRSLVISNTFGWPLREYPSVRRMLKMIGNPLVSALNTNTNALARLTATPCGVGRHLSRADRRAFLGPWRSRPARRASQQVLAELIRIDPLMSELELELKTKLADVPVLTLFGGKDDPLGWLRRFGLMFRNVTAVRIEGGHHFPFNDDPDRYAAAIGDWWAKKVAEAHRQF